MTVSPLSTEVDAKLQQSRVSHMGICVSDLARSVEFYRDALGFTLGAGFPVGGEAADLVGIPGAELEVQFVMKDGLLVELIHYFSPTCIGPSTPRPCNQLGMTHLSLRVADIDTMCALVEAKGGAVIKGTRVKSRGELIFCTDPDGTRIELMQIPDTVRFDESWA